MKKRSKYRPHTRDWLDKANPVGRAVALKNLHEDMLDMGITCLSAAHGSQQRRLLARLALRLLTRCDFIYLLPGWKASRGARLEHHVACMLGLCVLYAPGAEVVQ